MRLPSWALPCVTVAAIGATSSVAQAQANRNVSGVVVDATGAPVPGATITVKDGTASVQTGADGTFVLSAPSTAIVLVVTADGFTSVEVPVGAGRAAQTIAAALSPVPEPAPAVRDVIGVIRDNVTGLPIANAKVLIAGTQTGALTDDNGLFILRDVPLGDVSLEVTADTYAGIVATAPAGVEAVRVLLEPATPAPPEDAAPTSRTVRGTVFEQASDEPVPGAQVQVVGTDQLAFTDENGEFVIEGVALDAVTVEITSVGYAPIRLAVGAEVGEVAASLQFSSSEEIVIVGRAPVIVRQNLANGASVVDGETLNRVPAQTLEGALQGKLSGANLQSNSGAPGGGAQVRLRGISTINGQSSPLYVIDGVIISNVAVSSGANAITGAAAGGNPSSQDNPVNRIADINPADIESIEVLKGASAAALYGSKAANGVVIITTRRGRAGKNSVNVTQRVGVATRMNRLGARRWGSVGEVMEAFGADSPLVQAYMDSGGAEFDHEGQLTRTALAYETIASASGGSKTGTYFASVAVRDEPGIVRGTFYERQSARLSLGYDLFDRLKLNVSANVIHSLSDRGLTNNDNTGTSNYVVLSGTPSFVDLRAGAGGVFPRNPAFGTGSNPLQTIALLSNREEVWRAIGGANAVFEVYKDDTSQVSLLGNFGVDRFQQNNRILSPPELYFEPSLDGLAGTSVDGTTSNLNWNLGVGGLWAYAPKSNEFRSALSVGATLESADLTSVFVTAQNLTAGQPNIDSGTAVNVLENNLATLDAGLYLQEELALLDDRLSVLAGLLGERSSLNGNIDKYFLFPKLAAVYDLGLDEKQFDVVRVRGAYGEAGNRPVYGQKFTPLNATGNIDGNAGLTVGPNAGDPNIEPERQREIELGVDVATAEQRVVLELTGYNRMISNLVLQRALPTSTGFTTEFFNGGSLRNLGAEAALQVIPYADGDVEWRSRAVLTLNRSKVTDLPVPAFNITAAGFGAGLGAFRIEEGQSVTQIVGSIDGDGTIVKLGDGEPDFRVGWSNTVNIGPVSLFTLVDWQQGSEVINLTKLLYDFGQNSADYVGAGEARLEAFSNGDIRPYIEDATFVKLREVSVSYVVPEDIARQIGSIDALSVSLSGRNLLMFTNYTGLDPEVSNFGNQPIGRNYDVAPYPPGRSFWLSVTASM